MRKYWVAVIAVLLFAGAAAAEQYDVKVQKVSSNRYRDLNSDMLIHTSMCQVSANGEDAILIWNCSRGSEMFGCGKLIFTSSNTECQVDAVY